MRLIVGLSTSTTGLRRPVFRQMLEQAGQRRETAAHGRRRGTLLFPLYPLPRDDGAVVDLAQLVHGGDPERLHEVAHVELVGAAGLGALVLREPDFFLGMAASWSSVGIGRERRGTGSRIITVLIRRGIPAEGCAHNCAI